MKDWYDILGVDKEASSTDIKYAYRTKARKAHSDRGGNDEDMKLLNEAYSILSDFEKRKDFDIELDVFEESDMDNPVPVEFDGYLSAGNTLPYSENFRRQHAALTREYARTPLKTRMPEAVKEEPVDIFLFLRTSSLEISLFEKKALTPIFATQVLMDFLAGAYDIEMRASMLDHLSSQMKEMHPNTPELKFYQGVYEIIALADADISKQSNLIFAFTKITDAAKEASHHVLPLIIPLFYHEPFRNLYAKALKLYWQGREGLFEESLLEFDGIESTKAYLQELREQITSNHNKMLIGLLRRAKLLYQFEKSAHERDNIAPSAVEYREAAFHYLNWIPVFREIASREMFMNLFLQIGARFQQAAQLEENQAIKMADEKMAFEMYRTAVAIAHHCTPDKEMYAASHALRYLHTFEFEDETLTATLSALERRALHLADVFPFFEPISSNLAFLKQENHMLYLMRQLLNTLVTLNEARKNQQELILDHSAVTILYQAYEACLKNWYQENYEPELEEKFRINLMDELLFEKGWTFFDVEQHLHADYNLVNRDEDSWLKPVSALPYAEEESVYSSLDGIQFNYKTGAVEIFLTPWSEKDSASGRLFTLEDVEQLLEKNIDGAFFSLDPVDADKPYHPFNQMRFAPSRLQETALFHSMLLTDYMLKFFTTGQEVQGEYPFNQRSIETMLSHVPQHLKRIITNFQNASHSGAIHRFWIEAEEVNVPISDEKLIEKIGIQRLGLNRMRMVVKKHRMEWVNGKLEDVGNEDEGWPIYVLKPLSWQALLEGRRKIEGRAMIFIYGERKLFYWENHEIVKTHVPHKFDHGLSQIYCKKTDAEGRIHPNSEIMPLLFWATKEMAEQSDMPNHYSSEFIFAQEFTEHYGEFAQYFPEFGRLRELSKVVVITRLLNHSYAEIRQKIEDLDYIIHRHQSLFHSDRDPSLFRSDNELKDNLGLNFPLSFTLKNQELINHYSPQFEKIEEEVVKLFASWKSKKMPLAWAKKHWFDQFVYPAQREMRAVEDAIGLALEGYVKAARVLGAAYARKILDVEKAREKQQVLLNKHPYKIIENDIRERIKILSYLLNYPQSCYYPDFVIKEKKLESKNINPHYIFNSNHELYKTYEPNIKVISQFKTELTEMSKIEQARLASFQRARAENNEPEKDQCLWVPASVNHKVDTTGLSRYSFFVYGGVRVQPRANIQKNGLGLPMGNRVDGSFLGRSGGIRNPTTVLVGGASKEQVRTMMKEGKLSINQGQTNVLKEVLGSGRMTNVRIHKKPNGSIHVACERPGHDGFQRMSFKIDESGKKVRIVQTAYTADGNIVHQKPGQSKDNLYDRKK